MRMKMYSAESFDAAKALIAAEMGDDAIILSEREVDGGVEVRAAVDKMQLGESAQPLFLKRPAEPAGYLETSPLRKRIKDMLTWHGAPRRFADRVSQACGSQSDLEPEAALAIGLEAVVRCDPLTVRPDRDVLLVGPPGHGRTSTAAKLVRRAAVAGGRLSPIAADFDATAGGEQLKAYLLDERDLVRVAGAPDDLFSMTIAEKSADDRVVIDLPAIVPFDSEDLSRLSDLATAINAEPVLVMSAEGHPDDQAEAARAYAQAGVKRAILTKLDVARRRGGAVAALSGAGLAISHLAATPFIGGGLVPALPPPISPHPPIGSTPLYRRGPPPPRRPAACNASCGRLARARRF